MAEDIAEWLDQLGLSQCARAYRRYYLSRKLIVLIGKYC